MSNYELIILSLGFFFIALCYSSAGFGGGSSYIAILVLVGLSITTLRPTALLCNIAVVSGGTLLHYRAGHIDFKKSLPLLLASIPMAFIGGYWPIKEHIFFILLGVSLLVAALFLWFQPKPDKLTNRNHSTLMDNGIGGGIGLLAGLTSIGGGIFLSPILHITRWSKAKHIAALTSFFILVNSIAGLAGQLLQYNFDIDWGFTFPLVLAVFVGGQIGTRLSIRWFSPKILKRVTAVLILIVGIRILYQQIV